MINGIPLVVWRCHHPERAAAASFFGKKAGCLFLTVFDCARFSRVVLNLQVSLAMGRSSCPCSYCLTIESEH